MSTYRVLYTDNGNEEIEANYYRLYPKSGIYRFHGDNNTIVAEVERKLVKSVRLVTAEEG